MKKRRGIGFKIFAGFFTLIVIFAVNAIISVYTLSKNRSAIDVISKSIDPALNSIKELNMMVVRSRMFSANWVYLSKNEEDKNALRQIHSVEYPDLKTKLKELSIGWEEQSQIQKLDSMFMDFDDLIKLEADVMNKLANSEDYDNTMLKFEMEDLLETEVIPRSNVVIEKIGTLTKLKNTEKKKYEEILVNSSETLRMEILFLSLILITIGIIVSIYMSASITNPINKIKDTINKLSLGELSEVDIKESKDEIGEMVVSVKKHINGLRKTSAFADNVGNGNLDVEFTPLSDKDILGHSLVNMRTNLKHFAKEENQRSWITTGLAKFVDILRANHSNINDLSQQIISNLVKYTGANQGGLYLINEDNEKEKYLELLACYAFDRNKYVKQKVDIGEGLLGQCIIEQDTIFITEVPANYIHITSGLGLANPRCILIVPLKLNETIYGAIELATFVTFEKYQIEFVEKLAESIASSISSVKVNERTARLLEESQQLTEQMRAQEEEMRQNMEELQATQEEMNRRNAELQS